MEENNVYGVPNQGAEFENPDIDMGYNTIEDNTYVGANEGVVSTYEAPVQATVEQAPVVEQPVAQAQEAVQQPQPPKAKDLTMPPIPEEDLAFPKIVVETEKLKSALSKADVVATKNELNPVSEIVEIRVWGKGLQVRSSDRDNMLTVYTEYLEGTTDGASVTLKIAEIKPLIDRLKGSVAVFIIADNVVTLYGASGKYNFNQALDLTTNSIIKIPNVEDEIAPIPVEETIELKKEQFYDPISQVFPLVQKIDKDKVYASVHIGENITTTTGDEVALYQENLASLFNTTIFLKSTSVKDLLSLGVKDKIRVGVKTLQGGTKAICMYADDYRLYVVEKEGEDEYPTEDIKTLTTSASSNSVIFKRSDLIDTCERLTILMGNLTRKALNYETVNGNRVSISNDKNGKEMLITSGSGNVKINVDAERIIVPLKAIPTEEVVVEQILDDAFIRISSPDRKIMYVIGTALQQ